MTVTNTDDLLEKLIPIARQAGDAIMEVYESDDFDVEQKDDNSPLTRADKAANDIIVPALEALADYPVISEENDQRETNSEYFWLVDPLDGTKEFIKRNGEFTVNIALVRGNRPILGVVYAPVLKTLYLGNADAGRAYMEANGGERIEIRAHSDQEQPVIVTSRSHKDERTEKLLETLPNCSEVSMGSSLKLCAVAEGKAALYPRLGPTSLWDTAAADAVVTVAGGAVKDLQGERLTYEPNQAILNPEFVVECENNKIDWQKVLN